MRDLEQNKAREPHRTIELTARMQAEYRKAGDRCLMASTDTYRGMSFNELGQLDSRMACMLRSFRNFKPGCDSLILMRAYLCRTDVHLSLQENEVADSIASEALALWNPRWGRTAIRNGLLTNRAIAKAQTNDLEGALASFRAVLDLATKENLAKDVDDALTNIGVVHAMMNQLDSSDHYFRIALRNARARRSTMLLAKHYMNLADNQHAREQHRAAILLFDSALAVSRAEGYLQEAVYIEEKLSEAYAALGQHAEANAHLKARMAIKDSLLGIEKQKSITEMQEKYESEKKAKEILGLKAENLESELAQARVKRTRNIYLFSGIGVLLAAGGLWSRLRYVHRAKAAIQKEKDISEGLLLNILPQEVAAELKQKGEAEARLIDEVTVLFTDFKGFTAMSEKLSPKELVRDIHECFSAFDRIMERHGMEKIKTIGDAYMAAGGLPVPNTTHAGDAVRAALELRDFIEQGKHDKMARGLPFFEVRIGIHTGPVVAGIVGVKKFAYDIWGDTVNTASRMESSGAPGRVNISQSTHALIKQDAAFRFEHRGRVQAKGKGEIEMWFVEPALPAGRRA